MKLPLIFSLLLLTSAQLMAAPISKDIKLDHFGYRTGDTKIAYFTADPKGGVEVRDARTDEPVYTSTQIQDKGKDKASPLISGDHVWWVDFSGFTTAGRYYLYSPALAGQSYDFWVRDNVYQAPLSATLKALYYQRCGTPKPAVYAGAPWSDADPCHTQDAACPPAPGCKFPMDYGTLDLSGGWHDAGDYNKYIGSTPDGSPEKWGGDSGATLEYLLTAYELNPGLFQDKQLNIPESGNSIPDLLDECKWELDWYLKMQRKDKHVLSVIHQKIFTSGSPPSTDKTVRYYYPPNPMGEAQFVAFLSHAARVFHDVGSGHYGQHIRRKARTGLTTYALTLKTAAEATWNQFVRSSKPSDHKFWAAAEIFSMEQDLGGPASIIVEARDIVDKHKGKNWQWVHLPENQSSPLNYGIEAYVQSTSATPAVVANMKEDWGRLVDSVFELDDLYHSGMRHTDYYWGSSEVKVSYAMELVWGAILGTTGSHTAAECREHAEDFLHYLNGSNPLNMVYMTNSAMLGASHGVWRIFHYWFGNYGNPYSHSHFMGMPATVVDPLYPYFMGTDNFGISDTANSISGPPPGIVTDGPTYEYGEGGGKAVPPLPAGGGQMPIEKEYRDWNYVDPTGGKTVPWVVNETGIYYISSYAALASVFASPDGLSHKKENP